MSNYSHAEIFGSTLARGSSLFLGAAPDPFLEVGVVTVTLRVVAALPLPWGRPRPLFSGGGMGDPEDSDSEKKAGSSCGASVAARAGASMAGVSSMGK